MTASPPAPPRQSEKVDVLIVGAGPTGLTLACELARAGVSMLVVESSLGPQRGSRGKGIQPRSLEAFDNLGIVEQILASGRTDLSILSIDAAGQETVREPVGRVSPDVPYPATLIIPQWRVEEALRDRLYELGCDVTFGTELASFEDEGDQVLAAVTAPDGIRIIEARWLVGCDGGHSHVRRHAGIAFLGRTDEDVRMIVADVGVAEIDRDHWRMWRHLEGFLALCPLPSTNLFQFQASIAPGQDPALTLANMQALLDRRTDKCGIRLTEPCWSSLWRANVRMVDRYRKGRILLAGDSAHVHSPAGGQGMNTGIQDARNLGWKLAAVTKGARPELLDTYQKERLPVATSVLALSDELLKRAVEARGIVVTPDERTRQLGITYRGLSLASEGDAGSAALQAGDRAPDASGLIGSNGECRLFDFLRGGHFTLLIFHGRFSSPETIEQFAGISVRTLHVVSELRRPIDVIDARGHLASAYGLQVGMAILIRPDGHIGMITHENGIETTKRYLTDVLG